MEDNKFVRYSPRDIPGDTLVYMGQGFGSGWGGSLCYGWGDGYGAWGSHCGYGRWDGDGYDYCTGDGRGAGRSSGSGSGYGSGWGSGEGSVSGTGSSL